MRDISAQSLEKGNQAGLFLPNNHSNFEISFKPAESEKKKEALDVLTTYGLLAASVEQVNAWEKMSNNFKITLTDTNQTQRLLRKNISNKSEERIKRITEVVKFLGSQGIAVPELITTPEGGNYILHEGHFWQLFSFIEGNYFQGTEDELREVAKSLAAFHRAMATLPVEFSGHHSQDWEMEDIVALFNQARLRSESIDVFITEHSDFIVGQAQQTKDQQKTASVPVQPIHRDLHPHNTIFKDSSLQALLDFDDVSLSQLVRDVGGALHRFVRQFVVHQGSDWQQDLSVGVRLFLDEYMKINPLSSEELRLMPDYIIDELIGKIKRILTEYYINNNSALVGRGNLEKMFSLLREATIIKDLIKEYAKQYSGN